MKKLAIKATNWPRSVLLRRLARPTPVTSQPRETKRPSTTSRRSTQATPNTQMTTSGTTWTLFSGRTQASQKMTGHRELCGKEPTKPSPTTLYSAPPASIPMTSTRAYSATAGSSPVPPHLQRKPTEWRKFSSSVRTLIRTS